MTYLPWLLVALVVALMLAAAADLWRGPRVLAALAGTLRGCIPALLLLAATPGWTQDERSCLSCPWLLGRAATGGPDAGGGSASRGAHNADQAGAAPAPATTETPACYDVHGQLGPCRQPSLHWGEYAVRGLIGKGVDITTTAIGIEAGGMEGNKLQPTVEHRVGFSLLEVGAATGLPILVEKRWGYKSARWVSRGWMAARFAAGAWNLGQAFRAQRRAQMGPK